MDKKQKKTAINPINKKYNKCFQYALTVPLNHEEIKKDPQRITKIKPFMNKCNSVGINFPSEKDDSKNLKKIIKQLFLMFCMLKNKKYILHMFQNITQIMKSKLFF